MELLMGKMLELGAGEGRKSEELLRSTAWAARTSPKSIWRPPKCSGGHRYI
jgi:hypothetical protein